MKRLIFTAIGITALATSGFSGEAIGGLDAGGRHVVSASFTIDGSVGAIGGTGTSASLTERAGYVGQLMEATNLMITVSSSTVPETGICQLGGAIALDDGTVAFPNGGEIIWGQPLFPIASIDAAGTATACAVYTDTSATVAGSYLGLQAATNLLVKDTNPDNYGAYAGDGLPDWWQIQYFGLPPNLNAGPSADPSHTGQNNLFKYVAGLNPTDSASVFNLAVKRAAQSGRVELVFSPCVAGRTYTLLYSTNLNGRVWLPFTGYVSTDNGSERTVTNIVTAGVETFYRVEITMP